MKIVEVGQSGAGGPDYVVLQMYAPGQNLVGGKLIRSYDGAGMPLNTFTFPSNVTAADSQRTIYVARDDGPPLGMPDFVSADLVAACERRGLLRRLDGARRRDRLRLLRRLPRRGRRRPVPDGNPGAGAGPRRGNPPFDRARLRDAARKRRRHGQRGRRLHGRVADPAQQRDRADRGRLHRRRRRSPGPADVDLEGAEEEVLEDDREIPVRRERAGSSSHASSTRPRRRTAPPRRSTSTSTPASTSSRLRPRTRRATRTPPPLRTASRSPSAADAHPPPPHPPTG